MLVGNRQTTMYAHAIEVISSIALQAYRPLPLLSLILNGVNTVSLDDEPVTIYLN